MSSEISSVVSGGISEHESSFDHATWLVHVRPGGAKSKSGCRVKVGDVNDGEIATKEEAVLHPGRSHGEGERAAARTIEQVGGKGICRVPAGLDVFRPHAQR